MIPIQIVILKINNIHQTHDPKKNNYEITNKKKVILIVERVIDPQNMQTNILSLHHAIVIHLVFFSH